MEIDTALLTEGAAREALRSAEDRKVEMRIVELWLVYLHPRVIWSYFKSKSTSEAIT